MFTKLSIAMQIWQRFVEIVLEAFELRGASVVQWVCCKEPHRTGGIHFHMAIKLSIKCLQNKLFASHCKMLVLSFMSTNGEILGVEGSDSLFIHKHLQGSHRCPLLSREEKN